MNTEMNFLTEKEIRQYRTDFNPRQMSQEYLDEILSNLDEKPVWYERDLSEKPETHAGICICRNCRQIYWITSTRDAYGEIKSLGQVAKGPFCETCAYDISKKLLREQK